MRLGLLSRLGQTHPGHRHNNKYFNGTFYDNFAKKMVDILWITLVDILRKYLDQGQTTSAWPV